MSITLMMFNACNVLLPTRNCHRLRRQWLRRAGISVGDQTRLATGVKFYDRHICIGNDVWIGPETSLASCEQGLITIGDRVDIAPRVVIVSGSHDLGDSRRRAGEGTGVPITIGTGTWVGAHATILGGAHIGCGCVIAAGSVVIPGEYPDNVLLAGVPAMVKKELPCAN